MEQQHIDLALIPFAMRRSDGEMVDVYSVKRGRECGCICPSCKTPMIARQGPVREWHFAHETRQGGTENVCEYSALVSIRLMAHQILANIRKMRIPAGPYAASSSGREVTFDSVEIDARFEGHKVDAVATVKGTPLVLYLTYKSRPVPSMLSAPADKKAGVLRIDLPSLWHQIRQKASQNFERGAFERALIDEVGPKKWVYHLSQITERHRLYKERRQPRPEKQELRAQLSPPRPKASPRDNAPLLSRFRCEQCGTTWIAGFSESDANRCHICARATGVRIE